MPFWHPIQMKFRYHRNLIFCNRSNEITTFCLSWPPNFAFDFRLNFMFFLESLLDPPFLVFSLNICCGSPFLLAVTVIVVIAGIPLFGPPPGKWRLSLRWKTPPHTNENHKNQHFNRFCPFYLCSRLLTPPSADFHYTTIFARNQKS